MSQSTTSNSQSSPLSPEQQALWAGLGPEAVSSLEMRSYATASLPEMLATVGLRAGLLREHMADGSLKGALIPGVELLARPIYPQRHRGWFGEFARQGQGRAGEIGFWPGQWATAMMYAGTAKGFHIHPPHIPQGTEPAAWFRRLFLEEPTNYALRPYDKEQWDLMFFPMGRLEMILVDERAGMPRRVMRFWIDGDEHRTADCAAVLIPAGVAHALRAEGSADVLMVYGTSTTFNPAFEGRIQSGIESAGLPPDWEAYLARAREHA
jgi:dTDP-4-dehydrorhamnose 3,5-epimerase-like enzyme